MSVRDPRYLSLANGAYLVVDHFLRDLSSIKKKEKKKTAVEQIWHVQDSRDKSLALAFR